MDKEHPTHDYKSVIVPKPWGYEFLIYRNENVGIWLLSIIAGRATSLHCHPNKKTGLLLLQGIARLHFLTDSRIIEPLSKATIRNGVFHRTSALTDILLLETESPNNKSDLVRLRDDYGRASRPYETQTQDRTIDTSFFLTEDDEGTIRNAYGYNWYITDDYHSDNGSSVIVLRGGLIDIESGLTIVTPGDIFIDNIWNILQTQFSQVPNTRLLVIERRCQSGYQK